MKHHNIQLCMDTMMYVNEYSIYLPQLTGPSSTKVWFQSKPDIIKNTFVHSMESSGTTTPLDL